MHGTPQQEGVAERRNCTLINMVRSMLNYSNVLLSLWTYALKINVHLLNRIPRKAVSKTPYELWTRRKSSLRHLHIWGCQAEVRAYNPHEKKLDARTISGFFTGYPEKSRGYRFYCPNHSTRIIESGNVDLLKMANSVGVKNHINWILWRLVKNLLRLKSLLRLLSIWSWYRHITHICNKLIFKVHKINI